MKRRLRTASLPFPLLIKALHLVRRPLHIQVVFKLPRQFLWLLTVLFLQEVSRTVPGMVMLLRDIQRVVLFRQLVSWIGTTAGPMGTIQVALLQVVLSLQLLSRTASGKR
jgi:hypothetical protein